MITMKKAMVKITTKKKKEMSKDNPNTPKNSKAKDLKPMPTIIERSLNINDFL